MMFDKDFYISGWASWMPSERAQAHWLHPQAQNTIAQPETTPSLTSIPSAQKRRLSPLAKAVFHTYLQTMDGLHLANYNAPHILCSHYGESERTYKLLNDAVDGADLSPMSFSLSVHNAILGQLSIATQNTAPTVSIAPGDLGVASGLIEALCLLQIHDNVALTFADTQLPADYSADQISPEDIFSLTLVLSKEIGRKCGLNQTTPATNQLDRCQQLFELATQLLSDEQSNIKVGNYALQIGARS